MNWIRIKAREELRIFCREAPERFVFHLGDLEEEEWPHTEWYGWYQGETLEEVALVYSGLSVPCVQLLGRQGPVGERLLELAPLLPRPSYVHLRPEDMEIMRLALLPWREEIFWRMVWRGQREELASLGSRRGHLIEPAELEEAVELLSRAYPGSYFEPTMLTKGPFAGVREEGVLRSCAGVLLHSRREGVAMLGNIATDLEARNRGLARAAVACLLESLAPSTHTIALNVHQDNEPALRLYRHLGFVEVFPYSEAAL